MSNLYIGSCSWKYPSWKGLVYSAATGIDYLQEYAQKYNTVEVDQWFWSLFADDVIKWPAAADVAAYRRAVPPHFRFSIKAPNSLTLTHFYQKNKNEPLRVNPHFLSADLYRRFLETIAPLHDVMGPILLQFEYLNRQKISSQKAFMDRLKAFRKSIPAMPVVGIETRNASYLNNEFFGFLSENHFIPVLLQGYWMPSIVEVYKKFSSYLKESPIIVIRLHGPDRSGIERESGGDWSRTIYDRSEELQAIAQICCELLSAGQEVYVNVNNHYEGSAPLTIARLINLLQNKTYSLN